MTRTYEQGIEDAALLAESTKIKKVYHSDAGGYEPERPWTTEHVVPRWEEGQEIAREIRALAHRSGGR